MKCLACFKGNQYTETASPQNDEKLTTAETIAEEYKTSPKTVRRAEKFVDAVDAHPKMVTRCYHFQLYLILGLARYNQPCTMEG